MKYYERVMRDDEKLVFAGHLHWIVYWRAIVFLLFAIAALIGFEVVQPQGQAAPVFGWTVVALFVVAALVFFAAWIKRFVTEIAVTDRRVIYKRGLIVRHTEEMNITRIETVDVDQGVVARMLRYGNVVIRGTGGGVEPLRLIAHPLELRSAILAG